MATTTGFTHLTMQASDKCRPAYRALSPGVPWGTRAPYSNLGVSAVSVLGKQLQHMAGRRTGLALWGLG